MLLVVDIALVTIFLEVFEAIVLTKIFKILKVWLSNSNFI